MYQKWTTIHLASLTILVASFIIQLAGFTIQLASFPIHLTGLIIQLTGFTIQLASFTIELANLTSICLDGWNNQLTGFTIRQTCFSFPLNWYVIISYPSSKYVCIYIYLAIYLSLSHCWQYLLIFCLPCMVRRLDRGEQSQHQGTPKGRTCYPDGRSGESEDYVRS